MTALTTRDALAKALRSGDLASHIRDARSTEVPCEHWVGQELAVCSPCLRDRIVSHIIEALLGSGAIIDAATLPDDEALVTSVARAWYDREQPPFGPVTAWDDLSAIQQWRWRQSVTDNLRALPAALSERGEQS